MSKKYNVGIIGYGWVATAHIPAINESSQAQVTAVYSTRPQDGAELSAKYDSPITTYTSLDAMLADPSLHAVSVCSMPSLHAKHVIAAARAGKHIIIEKPLAMSQKDVTAMIAAVKAAGVKTCVCFECRYSSQFQATKAVIDQGLLGTTFEVVAVGDIVPADNLAYLVKYDSTQGKFMGTVSSKKSSPDKAEDDVLVVNGHEIKVVSAKTPAELPWAALGVQLVIESTGLFTDAEKAKGHLVAGAKKVIISAPAKGEDITVVMGVNDDKLDLALHSIKIGRAHV